MFKKVLIANRGAIACRILRTLRRMGIASVAVYSDADRQSLHVAQADEAVALGAAPAAQSYLRQDLLLRAARQAGAEAIHPGYGFLSENAGFAEACAAAGIVFIGPTPQQMRDFGLKHTARALAQQANVPLLPGSELLQDAAQAAVEAARIGYPVMLKSTAGGGGIGMQLCRSEQELAEAFHSVERLARNNFSQGGVFLEKYVERARHIEVQIFGDGRGAVRALGERDCSLQRRNQKVVEETPAPGLSDAIRRQLSSSAIRLAESVQYRSAGTVEFVYDVAGGEFYFLEVNTRLQVEHGVTEMVTGVDLVEWMLRTAADEPPDLHAAQIEARGHSVQARLYAEDPARNFRPSSGLLTEVEFPATNSPQHGSLRIDTWVQTGTEVSSYYDPMLGKLIAHAPTRELALDVLQTALRDTRIYGIETNLEYLQTLTNDAVFRRGEQYTRYLADIHFHSPTIEVLQAGTHSCLQDYPGRIGFWDVGVPPSGPMDSFAFRLANRVLRNPQDAAALELTVSGPTLKFDLDTVIALTGARMPAELDGAPVPYWRPVQVKRGALLTMRAIQGAGQRTYLAVKGGFDAPRYMGSRATFTLGRFGGHGGRALRVGDVLRVRPIEIRYDGGEDDQVHADAALQPNLFPLPLAGEGQGRGSGRAMLSGPLSASLPRAGERTLVDTYSKVLEEDCAAVPAGLIPAYSDHWDIGVMYGPHGAPDFFLSADIDVFFSTNWQVHYNSSRTGVRLIGPKPGWARTDGGEAGLHPSNIHDNAYAVGAIDFTGDMPVILGPDGPSLGGFVCPATIVQAELWKIGQLRPGDTIRFHYIDYDDAVRREREMDEAIATLTAIPHRDFVGRAPAKDASPLLPVPCPGTPGSGDAIRDLDKGRGVSPWPCPGTCPGRTDSWDAIRERSGRGISPASGRGDAFSDGIDEQNAAFDSASSTSPAQADPSIPLSRSRERGQGRGPAVAYRQAGDKYLLIEYGPQVLDLELRFRVHALMTHLQARHVPGVVDLTPGIRSLQVHYDSRIVSQTQLLQLLADIEPTLPDVDDVEVPSRIVHLPLSWDDPATRQAIDKYMQSVRADAPWCPSNLEFIRRINGLDNIEEVRKIVFTASYLVMGLGDVYLGAPVATPLDPRHRLVTTKYNPARTWTPENAVGIGGAYLCVYGMEGPGGYQFVGRTVQMWNRYRQTSDFKDGKQWLLRFFDQVRFYPVSAEELLKLREDFIEGRFVLKTEETVLKLGEYRKFLIDNADSIAAFKRTQQAAFEAERQRWAASGRNIAETDEPTAAPEKTSADIPDGCIVVTSPVTGSIWQLNVAANKRVAAEQELLIVEAMKMEIPIVADAACEIVEVRCEKGRAVSAGETLLVVKPISGQ